MSIEFGQLLRDERSRLRIYSGGGIKDVSQGLFAGYVGIHNSFLSYVESGSKNFGPVTSLAALSEMPYILPENQANFLLLATGMLKARVDDVLQQDNFLIGEMTVHDVKDQMSDPARASELVSALSHSQISKRRRKELGLSFKRLERLTGLDHSTLSKQESFNRSISVSYVDVVMNALQIPFAGQASFSLLANGHSLKTVVDVLSACKPINTIGDIFS